MKRTLLSALLVGASIHTYSQTLVYVQEPIGLLGGYAHTVAQMDTWGVPDMNIPANAITDTLAFVSDGTAADSLGCNALVNGAEVSGKIAVIYRGTCQYGVKAFNAQNAGAVGVVIINNIPGAPVQMGGGTDGPNVTIPVVQISQEDGALLASEIAAGTVVMYIGAKLNFFTDDIGFAKQHILVPKSAGNPETLSANGSEFNFEVAAWVINYGNGDQTNAILNAIVVQGTDTLYNETSTAASILSNDSALFMLPSFSLPNYSGHYELIYTAVLINEEFELDNRFVCDFHIGDVFTYAPTDPNGMPVSTDFFQPAGVTGDWSSCVAFQDPNASRTTATGIWFAATAATGDSLDGRIILGSVLEWLDVFTGVSDPNFIVQDVVEVGAGEYEYTSNLANTTVFLAFNDPVPLLDNQRYLFCVTSIYQGAVFIGYDSRYDYLQHIETYDQPVSLVNNGQWFAQGFGTDVTSAIAPEILDDNAIGIAENAGVVSDPVFPNPAREFVNIPMAGNAGAAQLEITDMQGKLVDSVPVNLASTGFVTVDVSSVPTGTYLFNMRFEDGTMSSFRVVVNK